MAAYWTERDAKGFVWLCWYERMSDPRESRVILTRTLIGRPSA
jgi:hypothetical protein